MSYIDPTYQNPVPPSMTALLEAVKREVKKAINAVRIGIIQGFDIGGAGVAATVTVKIAQQQVTSIQADGTRTLAEYPVLLKVPVYFPAGGGYTLTFPIAAGDECIILFNDREIDNWLINGGGTAPTSGRVHDLSDGMALVGLRSNPRALTGISTTTTQLRSDDGHNYVEVAAGIVNINATVKINLTAPQVNIIATETNITGIIDVENQNGSLTPCTVHGDIITDGDVVADGVSLHNHIHSGVQTGGGDTGPPVP